MHLCSIHMTKEHPIRTKDFLKAQKTVGQWEEKENYCFVKARESLRASG